MVETLWETVGRNELAISESSPPVVVRAAWTWADSPPNAIPHRTVATMIAAVEVCPMRRTTPAMMNNAALPCSSGLGWRSSSAPVMTMPPIEATPKMKS
ncbi:hypothetical protein [Cryobacterium sp. GrIS_2_6]|uniref:hypothetical protein n=1 Tax=Cryobacterium sp. GrIS_2_6 TaxID=3162785 RepID=UPI002DF768D9|nr:hypothetical protein [Cryobacterium psychrotolerans]